MHKILFFLLLSIQFLFGQFSNNNGWNNWLNKDMKLIYRSDFSVDADGWYHLNGPVYGNIDNIYGKSNVLQFHADTTYGQHNIRKENVFEIGKKYKIYGYIFINNNTNLKKVKITDGYIDDGILVIDDIGIWIPFSLNIEANNNTKIYIWGADSTGSVNFSGTLDTSDDVFYVYDIRIYER